MSTFGDQVFEMGGKPVGSSGARYTGWWGVQSWFCDYDHGSDSNTGKTPTKAFTNLDTAISAAGAGDVIYIRNRDQNTASTDGETIVAPTTSNFVVPEAKTHMSIIGASNISHIPDSNAGYAIILKGNATANTNPVLDIQGGFTLVENLGFHKGGSTAGGQLALTGNSTSLRALGSVINNCLFRMYSNNTQASIYSIDNWFVTIYGCTFHEDNTGIMLYGLNGTTRRSRISHCQFRNQTAASITNNILLYGGSGQDILIDNCDFVGEVPTATDGPSGVAAFVYCQSAIQATMVSCNFAADTTEGTDGSHITDNGMNMIDINQGLWAGGAGHGGLTN